MSSRAEAFISRVKNLEEKQQTVSITLEKLYNDEIYVVWLERISENPGDGFNFLKKICEFADEMKVIITLTLSPHSKKLFKYYENLGFVQDGPATDTGISMYRHYERETEECLQ